MYSLPMAQHAIEVILTRQLAEYLAVPIFLVDPSGGLLFYNEPAERILGLRFEETGEMPAEVWARRFNPTDLDGSPLTPDNLPLMKALTGGHPAFGRMMIVGADRVKRRIEVAAWPVAGHGHRALGAVAMFWEIDG